MLISKEFLEAIDSHSMEERNPLRHAKVTIVKRIVHPKNYPMIYPQAFLGVRDFLLSDEYNQSYIKTVLTLPSFIMPVNGVKHTKSASIHHKKYSTWLQRHNKDLLR